MCARACARVKINADRKKKNVHKTKFLDENTLSSAAQRAEPQSGVVVEGELIFPEELFRRATERRTDRLHSKIIIIIISIISIISILVVWKKKNK